MVGRDDGRVVGRRATKTSSWRPAGQLALRRLRAQVAAKTGRIVTERDLVAGKPIASAERPMLLADLAQRRRTLLQRAEQIVVLAERDGVDLNRPEDLASVPDLVACVVLAGAA